LAAKRYRSYTFVPLYPSPLDVEAAGTLRAAGNPAARCPAYPVTMPQTGLTFFAATGSQAQELDRAWAQRVPDDSCPVVLLLHEAGLSDYLGGLEAEFVIGMLGGDVRGEYAGLPNVRVVDTADAGEVTRVAMESFNRPGDPCFLRVEAGSSPAPDPEPDPRPEPFPSSRHEKDQELLDALFGNARDAAEPAWPAPEPQPWGDPMPLGDDGAPVGPAPAAAGPPAASDGAGRPPVDPLAALAALRPVTVDPPGGASGRAGDGAVPDLPGGNGQSGAGPGGPRAWVERARSLLARGRPVEVPAEIGDLLLGTRPAPIVVVGSRKGGVGKTALSAGLAQAAGYALDGRAGIAALVDQNINNADQWGRLVLPEGVTTVREIMAQLENGAEFPGAPAYARTPALAVFPESRDPGDGYPPVLIQRFVGDLRSRFVVTFIDLPNTLPAFTSAEAAVTAAYVDQSDLVLVPTTDDPNALRGVIEYLLAPSMRNKTAVVPYIVSTERGIREDPQVLDLLQQIRSRAAAVVPFPKTEKATLAVVKGTSILDVDPRLRNAYLDLATVVARILVRAS
jgi:cellulose biosynthesis protein BcsQ